MDSMPCITRHFTREFCLFLLLSLLVFLLHLMVAYVVCLYASGAVKVGTKDYQDVLLWPV
jgi:hypothetical protein